MSAKQPALELDFGTPGRYTGFIDTGTIGVTGRPSNGTDHHPAGLRRAVEAFELGGNDRDLWHAYADLTLEHYFEIASRRTK